jgi:hypothetical protein
MLLQVSSIESKWIGFSEDDAIRREKSSRSASDFSIIGRTHVRASKAASSERAKFLRRVGRHGLVALGVLVFGLGIGILGYHWIAHLSWIDSLLNASMILGGRGPVGDPLPTEAAKIFASCYALFSGLAFVGIVSVLIAPFVHRLLHRFHAEEQ